MASSTLSTRIEGGLPGPWLISQPVQAPRQEPGAPLAHRRGIDPQLPRRPACSTGRPGTPAQSAPAQPASANRPAISGQARHGAGEDMSETRARTPRMALRPPVSMNAFYATGLISG